MIIKTFFGLNKNQNSHKINHFKIGNLLFTSSCASCEAVPILLVATHLYTPLWLIFTLVMLNWEIKPDCVIETDDVFCSGMFSSF